MLAEQKGDDIPEGWVLDVDGRPTTDATAVMAGTMLPIGEAKGAALVLMVEIIGAALAGAHFGFETTSLFNAEGKPPGIGQTLIAIDANTLSGKTFAERLEVLISAILEQPGTRLPGSKRLKCRDTAETLGVLVLDQLFEDVKKLASL